MRSLPYLILQNKSQTRSAKPTVGPSKPFTRPHFVNRMLDSKADEAELQV